MVFTYISLHDLILFHEYNFKMFLGFESIWENNINYQSVNSFLTYYFLIFFPLQIVHWLYELFHTFFVLTAQFVAFFAMVFWLFLFLYSFFVLEKHENYFSVKRFEKRRKIEELLILRNNTGFQTG
jgi:hypothetical protein